MSLYVITAVQFSASGEVERVKWASVDGSIPKFEENIHIVEIDRVIEAFDRGDTVELVFPTSHGNVSGGRVVRKVLPGGHETITEEKQAEGRMLKDMPIF